MMVLLVFLETPVAMLPTTALLGRAMFLQDLSLRWVLSDIRQALPGILWTQGIVRGGGVLVVLLVLLPLSLRDDLASGNAPLWLWALASYSLLLRLARPFVNEIVVLERNPVRRRAARLMTIGRRSRGLHRPNASDLIGRWAVTAAATSVLTFINYLDLRIRREGWEVELNVRAAAQELQERIATRGQLV
jgi:hypothetical protein